MFQEPTPATTPMESQLPWPAWLWGPGFLHSQRDGLAKPEVGGTAGGALEPAVANAPPTPQACLLRPQSAVCPGAGGGEKTQIRHRPGGLEPGCGLVLGVRRRELKPDGCLWLALSREAARPCCTTGPSFRLGLHPQHALLGDL